MSDFFFEKIDLILVALNDNLNFFSVSFHCLVSLATLSAWKKYIYFLVCFSVYLKMHVCAERTCIFMIFNTVWMRTHTWFSSYLDILLYTICICTFIRASVETGLTPTFYALLGGASSPFKMTIFGNLILNSCWFNLILWLFSRFS